MHALSLGVFVLALATLASCGKLDDIGSASKSQPAVECKELNTPCYTPSPASTPDTFDLYVDNDEKFASIKPDGKRDSPFRSIGEALKVAKPNSTIKVGVGNGYNESIILDLPGLKLIGEPGGPNKPKIYSQAEQIVVIKGSNIVVDGFRITNENLLPADSNIPSTGGITVLPPSQWITISNNVIYKIGRQYASTCSCLKVVDQHEELINPCPCVGQAHGINVTTYGKDRIKHVDIIANELFDLHLGQSEAITLNGNVSGFTIAGNKIHHTDNIAIDIGGFQEKCPTSDPLDCQASDGWITGNEVACIFASRNPGDAQFNPGQYFDYHSMGAIYVDGGTIVRIERNNVHDSGTGIEISSENGGSLKDFLVRNNVVYRNRAQGIRIGNSGDKTTVTNLRLINNTFVDNRQDTAMDDHGTIYFGGATEKYFSGIRIANNIFILTDQSGANRNYSVTNARIGKKNVAEFANNLFFSKPEQFANIDGDQSFNGFLNYFANAGRQLSAADLAKLFVGLGEFDYRLASASPAIDAGNTVLLQAACKVGPCRDFLCQARVVGSQVDIGAFEFQK